MADLVHASESRHGLASRITSWATVLTGMAAAQGLTGLAVVLLARGVEPTEFGRYLACYSLANLLVVLPGIGADHWLLTRGVNDPSVLWSTWSRLNRRRIQLLVPWTIALTIGTTAVGSGTYPVTFVALAAVGLSAESVTWLAYSALRNLGRNRQVTAIQITGSSALLLSAVALPAVVDGALAFAVCRAALSFAMAGYVLVKIRRLRRIAAVETRFAIKGWDWSFLASDLAASVYMRADILIIGIFLGAAGTGVYGPAVSLATVAFLIPNALYMAVAPGLAASRRISHTSFAKSARAQLAAQAASGLVLAGVVYWFAPILVDLVLGPTYSASANVLRILSPLLAAKSLSFGLGAILTTSGNQRWRTRSQMATAAFSVLLGVLVVRWAGVEGVAVAYVISELTLVTLYSIGVTAWWHQRPL